jgi:hypothetical protein
MSGKDPLKRRWPARSRRTAASPATRTISPATGPGSPTRAACAASSAEAGVCVCSAWGTPTTSTDVLAERFLEIHLVDVDQAAVAGAAKRGGEPRPYAPEGGSLGRAISRRGERRGWRSGDWSNRARCSGLGVASKLRRTSHHGASRSRSGVSPGSDRSGLSAVGPSVSQADDPGDGTRPRRDAAPSLFPPRTAGWSPGRWQGSLQTRRYRRLTHSDFGPYPHCPRATPGDPRATEVAVARNAVLQRPQKRL